MSYYSFCRLQQFAARDGAGRGVGGEGGVLFFKVWDFGQFVLLAYTCMERETFEIASATNIMKTLNL